MFNIYKYVSADKKSDTDVHNRKGLQECVPELINNNNIGNGHGDSERSLVRTPRSEIDRIWPHLTVSFLQSFPIMYIRVTLLIS
jgi:hypothetical protein